MLFCSKSFMRTVLAAVLCMLLILPFSAGAESAAEDSVIHVSEITLSETSLQVVLGIPGELTATVLPEDAANPAVVWSSSDESVATVQRGKIKGIAAGECDIVCEAAEGNGVRTICHVEVVVPVKRIVLPEEPTVLLVGASEELAEATLNATVTPENAYWQEVTWESSNEEAVVVDADGTVRGLAPGKAIITASTTQPDSKAKAQTQVVVKQAVTGIELDSESVRVAVKKSAALKATVSPETAANKKLTWTSSDESIATVTAQGAVQGVSAGDAVITATAMDGSEVSASCQVTVYVPVSRITLSETQSFALPAGLSRSIAAEAAPENATDQELIWTSSDETIATVDEDGTVTGVSFGKAKITASAADGGGAAAAVTVVVNQAVENIALKYEELYVPVSGSVAIKAEIAPDDAGNKKLEWTSSDEAVATVTREGKVTGVSTGEAVITARATDGSETEAECTVTVGEARYDEGYQAGLEYLKEEKYYSAQQAFRESRMADAEEKAQKCVQEWPRTGEIWHNKAFKSSEMYLTIHIQSAEEGTGCYLMVYSEADELASTMFIRETGKVTVKLPGGRYRIRDASGKEWFGTKEAFGKEGHYEYMVFEEIEGDIYLTDLEAGYEWTIAINVVEDTGGTGVGSENTDWDSWAGTETP